jgi:seryl-tRNA synthetase
MGFGATRTWVWLPRRTPTSESSVSNCETFRPALQARFKNAQGAKMNLCTPQCQGLAVDYVATVAVLENYQG